MLLALPRHQDTTPRVFVLCVKQTSSTTLPKEQTYNKLTTMASSHDIIIKACLDEIVALHQIAFLAGQAECTVNCGMMRPECRPSFIARIEAARDEAMAQTTLKRKKATVEAVEAQRLETANMNVDNQSSDDDSTVLSSHSTVDEKSSLIMEHNIHRPLPGIQTTGTMKVIYLAGAFL